MRTSAPPLLDALEERRIPYSCGGRTGLFLNPEIALFGEIFAWFVDGEWRDGRWGEYRTVHLEGIVEGLQSCFGEVPDLRELPRGLEGPSSFAAAGPSASSVTSTACYYKLEGRRASMSIPLKAQHVSAPSGASPKCWPTSRASIGVAAMSGKAERRTYRSGRDRGKPYFFALYNYLLHYARDAYEDFAGEEALDVDAVHILTIHQAKGLEWPVVFMPALVDGRFPSRLSGRPQSWLLPEEVFPRREASPLRRK